MEDLPGGTGNGNLQKNDVSSIARDQDGFIWTELRRHCKLNGKERPRAAFILY